jgi:hypothetical protein
MASSSPQRHPDDITHHLLRAFGVLLGVSVVAVVVWLVTDSQATTSQLPMETAPHRIDSSEAPHLPMSR